MQDLEGDEGDGHQMSDRNLLASERAKREQHDLIARQRSELEFGDIFQAQLKRPTIPNLGVIVSPETPLGGLKLSPE